MRIGLREIDAEIAGEMIDRLTPPLQEFLKDDIAWGGFFSRWQFNSSNFTLKRKREPTPEEKFAYELRKKREETVAYRAMITVFGSMATGGALIAMGSNLTMNTMLAVIPGAAVAAAGFTTGAYWTRRATARERLLQEISREELHAVASLLSLSRAERIYCDTLLLLTRMDLSPDAEQTVRQTLQKLNELLAGSRKLDRRRQSLLPVLGTNPVKELEAQYGELGARLDLARDEEERRSLQQSLNMCAARLENARQFERGLERLQVQQEALVQTLSSAQTSIARMQLAADLGGDEAAAEFAESVSDINRQTWAVEKAVEEVMTLRTGHSDI